MRKLQWIAIAVGALAIVVASHVGADLFADKPKDASSKASNDKLAEKASDPVAAPAATPTLAITKVIVFNSGVAYFERLGEVDGDTRIDLAFSVGDINDIIKSMVVQDLDNGKVSAVSFDSLAPVDKALRSFAVDLSDNPTYAGILNQARGERVEVVLQQSSTSQPGTINGAIIGIENKPVIGTHEAVEHLNLWCAEGMRSIKLGEVQRIRFLNPLLESDLKKALDTMTQSHDTQKKTVSLICSGKGKRRVRIGYVAENPIWKTSYRLVLDPEKPPFLQGWAVVENNSDEDWNKVVMSLISGRPISFQMDLYDSLYVQRPVIEPEQFAALRPSSYGGIVRAEEAARLAARDWRRMSSWSGGIGGGSQNLGLAGGLNIGFGNLGQLGQLGTQLGGLPLGSGSGTAIGRAETMNLEQGISTVANGTRVGDFFQYQIDQPVTLARQKSAMLPIVNKAITGTRVSIYNDKVHPRFALLGIRIKNDTDLHLNHGPVTVFEGASYAGDAYMPDLRPGQSKLLTYAVDLGTDVVPTDSTETGKTTYVKIVKGIVESGTKFTRSRTYTITNRSDQDRVVVIEHLLDTHYKLVDTEKPLETTTTHYRFIKTVDKGETVKLVVSEERLEGSKIWLGDSDRGVQLFIDDPAATKGTKDALAAARTKRWELTQTDGDIANLKRDIESIKTEQPRLRENLRGLPDSDPLVKKLRDKLLAQENEIEKFESEIKTLQTKADKQRKDFEEFLQSLTIEK